MPDIANNIALIKKQIPASVKLVAVSKTRPVEGILIAYNSGQICFGENKVQELLSKKDHLPGDIEWHLIGHLQTNKVKLIVPFIKMIESVDSIKLLSAIDTEAFKIGRIIDCLFQIHIAKEETKFGFTIDELKEKIESEEFRKLKSVRMCGVMGMATFTDEEARVREEFRYLAKCFNELKFNYFNSAGYFNEISMGMSGDYKIAVQEGSTMIRVGSNIFGKRNQTDKQ